MAIKITTDCINCDACVAGCPNKAIYPNAETWTMNEGTTIFSNYTLRNGITINSFREQKALSDDYYYVVPDKCTECAGFYDEPQCVTVCPVDCCVPDESCPETMKELEAKQRFLHA